MNPLVVLTFALIGLYSAAGVIRDKTKYSLNKTFWFFNLFFLSIAPLFQYSSGYKPWPEGMAIHEDEYILTNVIVIFFFITYSFFRNLKVPRVALNRSTGRLYPAHDRKYLLLGVSLACFAILCGLVGFESLFLRSANKLDVADEAIVNLLATSFLRIVPLAALAIVKLDPGVKRGLGSGYRFCEAGLIAIVVLSNFPTSISRFWSGSVLIGLFALYVCASMQYRRVYDALFVLVFCIIFPVMFMFKYVSINEVDISDIMEQIDVKNSFNSVDFDAYYMIVQGIKHVGSHGVTLGENLISVATSFIPRSLYPEKGLPTPYLVGKTQGLQYFELSFPLLVEGYLAFGLAGVFIFAAAAAMTIRRLDTAYWVSMSKGELTLVSLAFPFLLGLLIYLLRGSLYAGFVQTVLFVAPICLIYSLRKVKII